MSTAQEIIAKMMATDKVVAGIRRALEVQMRDVMVYGLHVCAGREVCARRARKLARRGEAVMPFGTTKTGKRRFSWMRRVSPSSIYKGQS